MNRNYYYLVASLREYAIDSQVKGFDAVAIREEIVEELSKTDRMNLRRLYEFYDVENIINALKGKGAHNALGNLTAEEIAEGLTDTTLLPKYIGVLIEQYRLAEDRDTDPDEIFINREVPIEKALWEAYYTDCEKSKCQFLRTWYGFDRTVRNIATAYTSRAQGREIAPQLIGDDEIVAALSRSGASDFGLRGEIEYVETLIQIVDNPNIIEKERKIDLLRWTMADELVDFDYFNINKVLSYMVKMNIIDRWMRLDRDRGVEMFNLLLKELQAVELVDSKTEDTVKK